jgi:uncharacterized protein (TIGR02145 family)
MKTKINTSISLFIILTFLLIACKKNDTSPLPTVITYSPIFIASTEATVGCTVKPDGGTDFLCGIYMGSSQNPETTGAQFQIGSDTGFFLGQITGLTPETQYFVTAYAKNATGENLGDEVSFTTPGLINDYDNNIYETVITGEQLWMASNLKTTHHMNGDQILTTDPAILDISLESAPMYQWSYGGDGSNAAVYGRLYTYYTITDSRGVCPEGWHIPTDSEWSTLESTLGGFAIAGSRLKEMGNSHWIGPYNLDATNESCFNALPGGYRSNTGGFSYLGNYGYWWSSTEGDNTTAWIRALFVQSSQVLRVDLNKSNGASVRCIKDAK